MSFNNILTVDIGNTKTSFCLRAGDKDTFFSIQDLASTIMNNNLNDKNTNVLISSVKDTLVIDGFESINLKDYYTNKSFLSMPVKYNETVGMDRLVCSFLPYIQKKKSIVIDSGTFTTIDVVDSNGFNGGYILPGLEQLRSAYSHGQNLKAFSAQISNNLSLANTSKDAIDRGLTLSYISSIEKVIKSYPSHIVILTGGNAKVVNDLLTDIDNTVELKENLIHESMQLISKDYL